jgi:hypothetical protein
MFPAAEPVPDLSRADLSRPRQSAGGSGFGRADRAVAALLRVPLGRPTATGAQAQSLFRTSIAVSAIRCLISYLAVPIALPFLGTLSNVGPVVEIILSVVALFFDVKALRRFWLAWHAWRWGMTFVYVVVMVLVGVLLVSNIASIA